MPVLAWRNACPACKQCDLHHGLVAHCLPVDASIVTGGNKQVILLVFALTLALDLSLDLAFNLSFLALLLISGSAFSFRLTTSPRMRSPVNLA